MNVRGAGKRRGSFGMAAGRTQLSIGEKIGLAPSEKDYLREYIDDRNRAKMQEHMEKGYMD
jgi:hypothetical protein